MVRKSRSVQGGNQIFEYEFRIGLRNYRANPVKVELWDRLPKPDGEAVAVNLVKTSVDLSKDASYQRIGRGDNLLLWDIQVPQNTIGDKTMYLTYEFRLEYARDLPQPRFVSGGLREAPIGGGAMRGLVVIPLPQIFGSPDHRTIVVRERTVLQVIIGTAAFALAGGCATLMALGSLTAALPVRVANFETALSPLQPWQLTQAPSKIFLPIKLAVRPSL